MAAPMLPLLLLLAALLAPSAARPPAANAACACTCAAPTVEQLTLGVVLPEGNLEYPWAWPRVASALHLAREALQPQLRHAGLVVRTVFASTGERENGWCDAEATLLKAAELKGSHDPDVLLVTSCFVYGYSRPNSGFLAKFWRVPLLQAGLYHVPGRLPGEVFLGPLGPSLAAFQFRLFQRFNWTARAVMVESRDMNCRLYDDLYRNAPKGQRPPERLGIYLRELGELGQTVRDIQAKGRVVFICGSLEMLHQIMHLAHAQNMTNGDYVFFYMDPFGESLRAAGHREAAKPWQSKKGNDTGGLREVFQTVLVITPHEPQTHEYRHFENQLVLRAQRDFGVAINDSLGHLVAGCFHDGLLLYLQALIETLREGGTKWDTSHIMEKMRSLKIQGVTGTVSINSDNDREMDFDLWAMRDVGSGEYQVVGHYMTSEDRINWTGDILWKKGGPPLDNPPCVFDQDDPSCVKLAFVNECFLMNCFPQLSQSIDANQDTGQIQICQWSMDGK